MRGIITWMICMAGFTIGATGMPLIAADDTLPKSDTTVISVGKVKVIIKEDNEGTVVTVDEDVMGVEDERQEKKKLKNFKDRWLLLSLGMNAYLYEGSTQMPAGFDGLELRYGKSVEVNLELFRHRINLVKHHLNLMYGLGFQFNNYRFANDVTLAPKQPFVTVVPLEQQVNKSKLATTYVTVPLLLNINTNPYKKKNAFNLTAGMYGGYLLGSHTKIKYADDKKTKEKDDFNLNKLKYGVMAEVGYSWFNLYGRYDLTGLFEGGEGPDLAPFSVGVVLIGF